MFTIMFQRHNVNIGQYLIATDFILNETPSYILLENTLPIARANMLFYTKKAGTVAVVILMTIASCSADIQEVRTQFQKNNVLSTKYTTKQHLFKLNCVRWCDSDRQMGKCKIAGYNKYLKTCSLSMDISDDALQVGDEMAGVFFIGKFLYIFKYNDKKHYVTVCTVLYFLYIVL